MRVSGMRNRIKDDAAFVTAIWMIVTPLVFAFFAGAGAGTAFNGFAQLLGTLFSIFGGASLIFGVCLLLWVAWQMCLKDHLEDAK